MKISGDHSPSPLGTRLSVSGIGDGGATDEEDDYSLSMAAVLNRRCSTTTGKKVRVGKRRTSSPFDQTDRRRSSVFTTSSAESTAITIDGGEGEQLTQEQIFENIRLNKEVLESVKQQPWDMRRKIKLVRQAKEYVRRHEGHLQERLAQSKSTKDVMASFSFTLSRWWQWLKREFGNLAVNLIPWELRIKEIESHFGSVVASYFTFLRWVFWINIVMTAIIACLIIVPEVLAADPAQAGTRKKVQDFEEKVDHLSTLWEFEGILKYSPLFYGYYTDQKKTAEGYPLPLSYFLTGLGIYVYSFVAILRKMAKNARQSKLSEKEDECIFSWKVFTGWDYMIGNPETAFNRFASITMGFKEALLEEKESKKDERNWKTVSLRAFANILVILLLVCSAYAVVVVVDRSNEKVENPSWWRDNEITLVMNTIGTLFPNLFELIGMLEKYHPRKQLRWQLGRIMVLNFLNLYTLMLALFGKVGKMTEDLDRLRPEHLRFNTTMIPIVTSSIAPNISCAEIQVNCSLLEKFHYNETIRQTQDILTFNTSTVLLTHILNDDRLLLERLNISKDFDLRFNQKEWLEILSTILPTNDDKAFRQAKNKTGIGGSTIDYHGIVNDYENLTLYKAVTPQIILNNTLDLIRENRTTLKQALPLLVKVLVALVPNRSFPTLPPTITPIQLENATNAADDTSSYETSTNSLDDTSTYFPLKNITVGEDMLKNGSYNSTILINIADISINVTNVTSTTISDDSVPETTTSSSNIEDVSTNLEISEKTLNISDAPPKTTERNLKPPFTWDFPETHIIFKQNSTGTASNSAMDSETEATILQSTTRDPAFPIVTRNWRRKPTRNYTWRQRVTRPPPRLNKLQNNKVRAELGYIYNRRNRRSVTQSDFSSSTVDDLGSSTITDTGVETVNTDTTNIYSTMMNDGISNTIENEGISSSAMEDDNLILTRKSISRTSSTGTNEKWTSSTRMMSGGSTYKDFTRGDIPGDLNGVDPIRTTSIPTTMESSTPTAEDQHKLLTRIYTIIQFITSFNSSRKDFDEETKVEEYADFISKYYSISRTKQIKNASNHSTNFSTTFERNSTTKELPYCYITACDNGTIQPISTMEMLNCSHLNCVIEILKGKDLENYPQAECYIPGSRKCLRTEATTVRPKAELIELGKLCWETMFGQELVKLTVMDLIFTVAVILLIDFLRAILVRICNPCWCWDLEKKFPQYGDFKIAENILHLVNNQGMIWMGLFFAPGLPAINLFKLVILMYIRSWAVMTCNVPHETVFRASRSNNFYFALLLFMLFLCVLPVGYAMVRLRPSWHCGPFSTYPHIYNIFTSVVVEGLPKGVQDVLGYIASAGIIIPLLVLLVLVIYYLLSLTGSLREANNDLKIQLRRERTEERRKMFKMAGGKEKETALSRWQAIIPTVKSKGPRVSILTSGKQTGFAGLAKRATLKTRELIKQQQASIETGTQAESIKIENTKPGIVDDEGSGTDLDQASLPEDGFSSPTLKSPLPIDSSSKTKIGSIVTPSESVPSKTSEIPVIKIIKDSENSNSTGISKPPLKKKPVPSQITLASTSIKKEQDIQTPSTSSGSIQKCSIEPKASSSNLDISNKDQDEGSSVQSSDSTSKTDKKQTILKSLLLKAKEEKDKSKEGEQGITVRDRSKIQRKDTTSSSDTPS